MLERPIGAGGMGVVWAARRTDDGGAVAIKILRGATPETARRLVREARIAIALFHPNIARVYEIVPGAGGGDDPVLVMELLRGESFAAKLARERRLSVGELSRILLQVCSALAAAHASGVVHRDLKPQNIFLTADSVKVLDFGIAKLLGGPLGPSTDLTKSGAVLGTPHFMAPEQVYGEADIDARADLWALGVIMYLALSGRLPVQGKALGEIFRVLAVGHIPHLLEARGEVPPPLAALVMRLLSRARDDRPSDVDVVVQELRRYAPLP
jgi:serine/threonine-protein kinase